MFEFKISAQVNLDWRDGQSFRHIVTKGLLFVQGFCLSQLLGLNLESTKRR